MTWVLPSPRTFHIYYFLLKIWWFFVMSMKLTISMDTFTEVHELVSNVYASVFLIRNKCRKSCTNYENFSKNFVRWDDLPNNYKLQKSIWVISRQLFTVLDLDLHRFSSNLTGWIFLEQIWKIPSFVTIDSFLRPCEGKHVFEILLKSQFSNACISGWASRKIVIFWDLEDFFT